MAPRRFPLVLALVSITPSISSTTFTLLLHIDHALGSFSPVPPPSLRRTHFPTVEESRNAGRSRKDRRDALGDTRIDRRKRTANSNGLRAYVRRLRRVGGFGGRVV